MGKVKYLKKISLLIALMATFSISLELNAQPTPPYSTLIPYVDTSFSSIAMLTPYVGGEGVYSARAMLGIDPEDYNLPYRLSKPSDSMNITKESKLKVYPNPANNQITIEIPSDENMYIEIFDVYGKFVSGYQLSETKNLVDISNFSKGVFIFKITNSNGIVESGKFIKL